MRGHTRLRLLEARSTSSGLPAWVDVTPRHRLPWREVVAALALFLGAALWTASLRPEDPPGMLVRVKVYPGDTLWGLARRYGGARCYLPKAVHRIRQVNGLSTSDLTPGQVLVIPVDTPLPHAHTFLLAQSKSD